MKYPIPNNLTVREVSLLTGLTNQEVRRKCESGEFIGHQNGWINGVWCIDSKQFLNIHPNWNEFIEKRNEMFESSKKVAEFALQLWDLTNDDIQDEKMRAERFMREKAENDEAAIIAEQEGRKQKAIEEAIKQRNIEAALEMIDAGLHDDIITRITQLTKGKIQSLREAKK
ncbi:hypothetical protein ACS2B2_25730 [Bacillus cereus group sp. BceL297]|uniref:hypothetical protein n=1 Tax=unclassified Bacillus cereus group TaxID=2750818 RepID=UPI003F27D42D